MKIARIETFILGTGSSKDLLFCRVETEDGLHGWGEAYVTHGKEKVVAECIQAMAPHVIGRSAFNIRHTGQVMFEDFAIQRGSLELLSAWSAIEIASWDIIGKRAGLPVYNLIGGASRERVRVYANGWSRGVDDRGGGRARAQGQGDGLHRRQIRPVPRPMAQLCRSPRRGFRDRLCPGDARGAGARFRATDRGAPPLCAGTRDPHRPAPRRIRHRLVRGAVPVGQYRAGGRGAPRGADPDRHRRGDLYEGGVLRLPRQARRRHPEPRHLRHWRDHRACSTSPRWRSRRRWSCRRTTTTARSSAWRRPCMSRQ